MATEAPLPVYRYDGRLDNIYDGDTYTFTVDLGFYTSHQFKVRLKDIDTAETWEEMGDEHTEFVTEWLSVGQSMDAEWPFVVRTYKAGSFSRRYIADIWRKTDGERLSDRLLEEYGQSVEYE